MIPWSALSQHDRQNITSMLNREFDVDLDVADAEQYYGKPGKVDRELGGFESDGPECSNCFKTLTAIDLDELEQTGCCPHCGHDTTSPADSQGGDANA
jgi:formamidopyrimidine-DNA glycosylase